MKTPALLLSILLLAILLVPASHSAHHRRGCLAGGGYRKQASRPLLPLRVLRTSQPPKKVVRVVKPKQS